MKTLKHTTPWLVVPIRHLLTQLQVLLNDLSDEQYTQKVELLSNATLGQHIRHIIEFFLELYHGYETGTINYDNRRRDYEIENNRICAITKLQTILLSLEKENIALTLIADFDEECDYSGTVLTNYARELVYNLEHTVHHMALIRVGVSILSEIALPHSFGVAASTLKYRNTCAS